MEPTRKKKEGERVRTEQEGLRKVKAIIRFHPEHYDQDSDTIFTEKNTNVSDIIMKITGRIGMESLFIYRQNVLYVWFFCWFLFLLGFLVGFWGVFVWGCVCVCVCYLRHFN